MLCWKKEVCPEVVIPKTSSGRQVLVPRLDLYDYGYIDPFPRCSRGGKGRTWRCVLDLLLRLPRSSRSGTSDWWAFVSNFTLFEKRDTIS